MPPLKSFVNPKKVAGRVRRQLDRRTVRDVDVRGVHVRMETRSRRERERVDAYLSKEPGTLDWIDQVVKPGDVFFDVGANIGQYGVYAALKAGGTVTVRCFEPEAANYEALNRNIALNALSGTTTAYLVALSDELKLGALHLSGAADAGGALHQLDRVAENDSGRTQGVLAISLDTLVYDLGLPCPTHIKVDVDGHEEAIIRGASRLLADPRLLSVLIEVNEGDDPIRLAFLNNGFSVQDERSSAVGSASVNVVFQRQ
ncbi:MAG: FkbM family methyltransferase [Chloroflexi bacterium]|nr:FkbM family methyltransferase [Chloroflexota bacterium]MDA1174066.1 FkbM family methyltransferase [Chloroflexota bacterium]